MAAQIPTLDFREASHEYWVGGRRIPSVTEMLDGVLRTSSSYWKPRHRLRGTWVHQITEAIDDGDYRESLVELPTEWPEGIALTEADREGILMRGRAYKKWKEHTGFEPLETELRLYSPLLGLCGTLDRVGRITKGTFKGRLVVVELKTGEPTVAAPLQVALYRWIYIEDPKHNDPRLTVILALHDNGRPVPDYREGRTLDTDTGNGLAVVQTFKFMREARLL